MEYGRRSVLEPLSVPDGLGHCLGYVQPLPSLHLYVDSRQAGHVRDLPEALRPARLHVIAVRLEDVGQLDLSSPALAL